MSSLATYFKPVIYTPSLPRLAVSVDGKDKSGKTHWSIFTAPGPLRIVSTDFGTKWVVDKALATRKIQIAGVMDLDFKEPDPGAIRREDVSKDDHSGWRKNWKSYKDAMAALVDEKPGPGRTRTLIHDTGTGIYKLCRLALFGKAKSIPAKEFDKVDAEMYEVFWNLYKGRPDMNLIFIHHKKKKYVNDAFDGTFERDGWNKIAAAVDIVLEAGWDKTEKAFYTSVSEDQATRMGGQLSGQKWVGANSGFKYLGMEAIPETMMTPEVWD